MSSHFLRSGTGRHRLPKKSPLLRGVSTTSVLVAATTSVLCGAGTAQADDDEPEKSGPVAGRNVGLLVVDNSHADSWLEVDRTLNMLFRSKGTAGSDHDGGGGAIDVQTGNNGTGSGDPGGSCSCPRPSSGSEASPAPSSGQSPGSGSGSGSGAASGAGSGSGSVSGSGSRGVIEQIGQIGHPPYQGENGE
ncbi:MULTISPECIES: hypothetical protein [unclassified Streptomyces]|uniref:hypothetical protein n=1 Tax=unclassified Streptomyces TaxID=2593676 RepID=UPI0038170800